MNKRLLTMAQRVTATGFLSTFGLALCVLTAGLLACNEFVSVKSLDPYYRLNTPAVCLLIGFMSMCICRGLALSACVLMLPLLPTFAVQLQLYTGYGRVQDMHNAGLDLAAGLVLGALVRALMSKEPLSARLRLPWPAGLVLLILTVSTAVAIMRNLHQTGAPLSIHGLIYNLLHLRTLGWHDDYRPLFDWIAYCSAFSILAVFIPGLKSISGRNDVIFLPLILGLVIAALVGWRQSVIGVTLSWEQLNFRSDQFGYMAIGFQPDLHAFGAQMLIGVSGFVGYLYYQKSPWLRVVFISMVLPLCWLLLFLSKSKATLALSVVFMLTILVIWWFRHAKYLKHTLLSLLAVCVLTVLSMFIFTETWLAALTAIGSTFGVPNWVTFNNALSYRPEVYLAAYKMFSLFPFAGLGLGEFYHQSANFALTQSYFLSQQQNGENAHNYFFQTLVENGVLGFSAFVLLLAYPLFKVSDKRLLIPAVVALGAAFGGNLFSHSMLVRDNLLIAACFVALMYAWVEAEKNQPLAQATVGKSSNNLLGRALQLWLTRWPWFTQTSVLVAATVLSLGFIVNEAYQSRKGSPFDIDTQCFENRRLTRYGWGSERPVLEPDGWTSGRYLFDMPPDAQGVKVNLATTQPDVVKRPLPVSLTIWYDQRRLVKQDFTLAKTGPQSLEVSLPAGTLATPDDYQIELKVQRCYVPRNFGMNGDGRRLGVKVDSVDWK
jgi:hypothetical protein